MFRLREKLKYMALGALIALTGFVLGNMNKDTEAQSGSETIEKLTVRDLIVLKGIRVMNDDNERQVIITWDEEGGRVTTYSPIGKAGLGVGKHGGYLRVSDVEGNGGAQVTMEEKGGSVMIFSANGAGGVALALYEGGGVVYTRDKLGNISGLD